MPELQLSFHGTFALKKEDILRILKAANEEKGVNDTRDNLVTRTGLGNEKVLRIKTWSIRSGLVDKKTGNLTPQGQIVLAHDPHLESPVTDWLMHFYLSFGDYGLSTPPEDAAEWGGWTWFIYSFLPQHKTFSRQELESYAGNNFTKAAKNIAKDLNILLRAYTEPYALFSCGIIRSSDKEKYFAGEANQPNDYLVAYFLSQLWQRDFGDINSVSTRKILEQSMGLTSILGIETNSLQTLLDRLESLALVEQNRAVAPAEIVRRWHNPLDLLEKAYEP
jgi:hypothetical protein